jgi:glycosyltransferase involved in cell wall biosynthesis
MGRVATVSVVIPAHNAARFLPAALDSVFGQTLPADEIIIVDDGSTDGTAEVVASYGDRVRYVEQAHSGANAARNKGLRLAGGRYVALLDSDDVWSREKLATQVPVLNAKAHVGLVYSTMSLMDEDGCPLPGSKPKTTPGTTFEELVRNGSALSSTFLIRASYLSRVGWFDETRTILQDLEFCLRLASQYGIELVPAPLARYRVHRKQATANQGNVFKGYASLYGDLLGGRYGALRPETARVVKSRYAHFLYLLGRVHASGGDFGAAADAIRLSLRVDAGFLARDDDARLKPARLMRLAKPCIRLLICGVLARVRPHVRQTDGQRAS